MIILSTVAMAYSNICSINI